MNWDVPPDFELSHPPKLEADECVDEIYACHVLEHVTRQKIIETISEWNRVLKHGGTLRIAVPDWQAMVAQYNETNDLEITTTRNIAMAQTVPPRRYRKNRRHS